MVVKLVFRGYDIRNTTQINTYRSVVTYTKKRAHQLAMDKTANEAQLRERLFVWDYIEDQIWDDVVL